MSNPYLNHLLDRVHTDLKFLSDQQLLTHQDLELIKSKLDSINRSTTTPSGLEQQLNGLQINPSQQGGGAGGGTSSGLNSNGQCKAVWNYTKSQPDDLGFQQGDVIDILEEVNADWWKGSLRGETGLFPSNHVERIQTRAPPPPPPSHVAPYNVGYSQPPSTFSPPPPPLHSHYGAPPPPSGPQYAYQQPQNYSSSSEKQPQPQQFYQSGPPQQHYVPPPPPPQTVMVSNQSLPMTEEEKKKKKFPGGQLGKTVGHAFAGGAGFGVGSALTSNAINAIF
ncbi:hypothetical protein JCM5350_006325 [Sporobolomyces pararoseus]